MRLVAVTRELRTAGTPLHRFFHERFPNLAPMIAEFDSRLVGIPTLYPPTANGTPPYATLGAAIDYRLLYYFWAKPYRALDAFKGARTSYIGNPRDTVGIPWQASVPTSGMTMVTRLVRDFFDGLEHTLATTNPVRQCLSAPAEELLCRYCYVLALFDEIYRHGGLPLPAGSPLCAFQQHETAQVADLLALADPWVADLCQLSWLFFARQRRMFSEQAWVHPKNIWRMAGAEADLLVNGYVIDFKTTIKPRLDPAWLYQVLCYVLLEYPPEHPVQGVGFYLVRQGVRIRWRLDNLLCRLMNGNPKPLAQLRAEFQEVLFGSYGLLPRSSFRSGRPQWHGRQ